MLIAPRKPNNQSENAIPITEERTMQNSVRKCLNWSLSPAHPQQNERFAPTRFHCQLFSAKLSVPCHSLLLQKSYHFLFFNRNAFPVSMDSSTESLQAPHHQPVFFAWPDNDNIAYDYLFNEYVNRFTISKNAGSFACRPMSFWIASPVFPFA